MHSVLITLKKHRFLTLSFFIPLIIYLFTLYPTVPTEDGGELTVAAYFLGIAHPPGYPLHTLLGKLFITIIPFGNIAWKVNVMSALFGALTISFIFLIIKKWTKSETVALLTGLTFAFSDIFWSQAIRAEVYTLNSALFAGILYLSLKWAETHHLKTLLLISFLLGLSLTNHHLMFLMGIPLALFILFHTPRILLSPSKVIKCLLVFIIGFSLYLYLPIRSAMNPILDSGNPETWENFLNVFFRTTYTKESIPFLSSTSETIGPTTVFNLFEFIQTTFQTYLVTPSKNLITMASNAFNDFSPLGFLVGILGVFSLKKLPKKTTAYILLLLFFYVFILNRFSSESAISLKNNFFARPFRIPFLLLFSLFIGLGFNALRTKALTKKVFPLAIIIPLIPLVLFFPQNNQRDNYLAYDLAKAALQQAPKNSIFIPIQGDNSVYPILYLTSVENVRSDLKFFLRGDYYQFPQINTINEMMASHNKNFIITEFPNLQKLPPSQEIIHAGLNTYITKKHTFSSQQKEALQKNAKAWLKKIPLRGLNKEPKDYFNDYLEGSYYLRLGLLNEKIAPQESKELIKKAHQENQKAQDLGDVFIAAHYIASSQYKEALPYLTSAKKYHPSTYFINFYKGLAQFLYAPEKTNNEFDQLIKNDTAHFVTHLSGVFITEKMCNQGIPYLTSLLDSQPKSHALIHNGLAGCYESLGNKEKTIFHFQESLKIAPKNINANYAIGALLFQNGNHNLAINYLQTAKEQSIKANNPNHIKNILTTLTQTYLATNQNAKAQEEAQNLLNLFPTAESQLLLQKTLQSNR